MLNSRSHLTEVATVFLKLGTIGFGGPAAHIAMLETEMVTRRQWVSQAQFLDLVGLTNLIPGPSSTELAIYLGYLRAGWWGLMIAGVCFILPAMAIVWGLAIGYDRVSSMPEAIAIFASIQPVVVVLTIQAMWKLRRSAVKSVPTAIAGVGAIGAIGFFDLKILVVLLLAGFGVMLGQGWRGGLLAIWLPRLEFPLIAMLPAVTAHPSWLDVLGIFLKLGATIYGGGYVLLAFLQPELVERTHWLTSTQLLDAIAIGQITPGPLFTTATFIGYLLAGHQGAIAATIGIFLPSFGFVALLTFWAPKLRHSLWFRSWLDGVNAGAWGAIAVATYRLGVVVPLNGQSIAIAAISALLLWRWQVDPLWPILGSATAGLVGHLAQSHR